MDNALIGLRIRQLRMDRQLRQGDVAKQLGISPAYLNLIEKGKRAVQLPLLWKVLQLFDQDLETFMRTAGESPSGDGLAQLLDDPLARTLELDRDDVARLLAEPKAATTIAALFQLYKNTRAQLDTTVAKLSEGEAPRLGYEPSDEVSDFLQKHRYHFPELEEAADRLRHDHGLGRRVSSDQLVQLIGREFGMRVEPVAPEAHSSVVRRIDRERGTIVVSTGLTEHVLKFQLAASAGLMVLDGSRLHERLVAEFGPRHPESERLIKIQLANYFGGALLLPYDDFFRTAQRTGYDVEALAAATDTSYEACAHRVCNLADPKRAAVPLHFLRVDVAGNISKKYSGTGIHFAQGSGPCPKWAVHVAFLTPSVLWRQYSTMSDGTTYFCFAKVTTQSSRGSLVRGTAYSIGLGALAADAKHLACAQGRPAGDLERTAVPVGVTCRFCERPDCNQRAAPSYKYAFAVDEYTKKDNFFSPLVGTSR